MKISDVVEAPGLLEEIGADEVEGDVDQDQGESLAQIGTAPSFRGVILVLKPEWASRGSNVVHEGDAEC